MGILIYIYIIDNLHSPLEFFWSVKGRTPSGCDNTYLCEAGESREADTVEKEERELIDPVRCCCCCCC